MLDSASLRQIETFQDLADDELQWLVEHGEEIELGPGEIISREGDAPLYMVAILSGQMRIRLSAGNSSQAWEFSAGEITGFLPFSRLKVFPASATSVTSMRIARFHKNSFPDMLHRIPVLGERLVGLMLDRVREFTRRDEQQQKLASLGKLSAGLAHELNNPAGAVLRGAKSLGTVRPKLREAYLRIDQRELTTAQRKSIAEFEKVALERAANAASSAISGMQQADREEALIEWLDAHNVENGYCFAAGLVEAQVTSADIEALGKIVGTAALTDVLNRIYLVLLAARLVFEIEVAANRIADLVHSIKQYTYMDQASEQEIDIHDGIESTLTMIGFKLRKKSIGVIREFDRTLPKICAFGAELNQVWTNLVVNAIDAMSDRGELRIKTWGGAKDIYVGVRDDGSGIAPDVKSHIFEPFYTTKGVGEGTGLGLDTVRRIVRKHRGEISVQSKPGDTHFIVRIPRQGIQ